MGLALTLLFFYMMAPFLMPIVLGAVVAMQTYVRDRLAGAIKTRADSYSGGNIQALDQDTKSVQTSTADMVVPGKGSITSDSQASQHTESPR